MTRHYLTASILLGMVILVLTFSFASEREQTPQTKDRPLGAEPIDIHTNRAASTHVRMAQPTRNDTEGVVQQASLALSTYLIDCVGSYLKIQPEQPREVTTGSIWEHHSTKELGPVAQTRFDGCPVSDVAVDYKRRRLYVVHPIDARIQYDATRTYAISALELPSFSLIASTPIERSLLKTPTILLTQSDATMLLTATILNQDQKPEVVSARYNLPTLQLHDASSTKPTLQALQATIKKRNVRFSPDAYDTPHGVIVDRHTIISENGTEQFVNGYDVVTDEIRMSAQQMERLNAQGEPYLPVAYADSSGPHLLFVLGEDRLSTRAHNGSGLLVYDIFSGHTLSPILTPFPIAARSATHGETPTAHLSPNGERIVVESYEWRSIDTAADENPSNMRRFKTGTFTVYDTRSGQKLTTISLEQPPGFLARVLGFSPDGNTLYVASQTEIFVIDLTGQIPPWQTANALGGWPLYVVGGS